MTDQDLCAIQAQMVPLQKLTNEIASHNSSTNYVYVHVHVYVYVYVCVYVYVYVYV